MKKATNTQQESQSLGGIVAIVPLPKESSFTRGGLQKRKRNAEGEEGVSEDASAVQEYFWNIFTYTE
jgi:hypothetical protein